tara:strand:- start:368 stop:835 length:468 start_codon:yes stop_codon:yes gene_type:complete
MEVKITSTFSFSKLADELEEVLGDFGEDFNKALAKDAFNFIKQGKVRPSKLHPSTTRDRISKGFKPKPALDRSSLLADTLEGTRDGILMQAYGKKHLDGDGVPKRDFLFTSGDKFRGSMNKGNAKRLEQLVQAINKAMQVSGSGRKGSLKKFLKK